MLYSLRSTLLRLFHVYRGISVSSDFVQLHFAILSRVWGIHGVTYFEKIFLNSQRRQRKKERERERAHYDKILPEERKRRMQ